MMPTTRQSVDGFDQSLVVVRALSSITQHQAAVIIQTVDAHSSSWTVQTCDDYDGYLSIIIEPADRSSKQSAYYISGTTSRIELAEIHDENLTALERHHDAAELAARLIEILNLTGRVAHSERPAAEKVSQ